MTEKLKSGKWDKEAEAKLMEIVGEQRPIPNKKVFKAAEALERTTRSVASKLRSMKQEVEPVQAPKAPSTFTEAETRDLEAFMKGNKGSFTYEEVANRLWDGKFNKRQIQGKLLSMELTGFVKPTPKQEAVRTYTEKQEKTVIKMANDGASVEAIAEAVGKSINSVRGKALSLLREKLIEAVPQQTKSYAKEKVDPFDALGEEAISEMTVAELAETTDRTERGVKTILTRRGINCADYKGQVKREKADARAAEEE